jgi:hypothetical protein
MKQIKITYAHMAEDNTQILLALRLFLGGEWILEFELRASLGRCFTSRATLQSFVVWLPLK